MASETDRPGAPAGPIVQVEARKAGPMAAEQPAGDGFTYRVLSDAERTGAAGDRRGSARQRTRLRSGKLVARDGRFLTECLIYNRSALGCLLRLPGPLALPATLLVYDDQADCLLQATVIWRRDREVGIRFTQPTGDTTRHQAIADSMRRKFYAVRN